MRRPARLTLAILLQLALLGGAYAAWWFILAGGVRQAIEDWAAARRAEGYTVGWTGYAVAGFPLAVRVEIEQPVIARAGGDPGFTARAPRLVGESRPWEPRRWQLAAADATLVVEPAPPRPQIALAAAQLSGSLAPRAASGRRTPLAARMIAQALTVTSEPRIAIAQAEIVADLPSGPAASHTETWAAGTIQLSGMRLPAAVPPLGDTVDRIAATLAVKGTIPGGPRREALARWREDGGTVELESFGLDWNRLAVAAKGTLALDEALQPMGALAAEIAGYDDVVDALVRSGSLRSGDAALAKLALGLLAKTGGDGRAQIKAPVTLQNGQIFLGPARLARLPVFTWQ